MYHIFSNDTAKSFISTDLSSVSMINCLRNKSALELIELQRQLEDDHAMLFNGPSMDGVNGLFPGCLYFVCGF
jgi:hypothetical protein